MYNYATSALNPLALQAPVQGSNPFTRNLLAAAVASGVAPQMDAPQLGAAQFGASPAAPQSGVGAFGPSSIGGAFSAQPSGSIPSAQLPDYMGGIRQAFADNAAKEPPVKRILGMRADTVAGVLGTLGDAMMAYGGLQPTFASMVAQQRQNDAEREFQREKWAAEIEADRQKRMAPRAEQVGGTIGLFDPSTLSYDPVWQEPEPFENYARALGLEPGTPEYYDAIREYRAGTWNPTGVEGRLAVQAPRLEQSNINNIRSTSTSRENNIRSTGTSRENNIRSTQTSRDNSILSNETRRQTSGGRNGGRSDLVGQVYQRGGRRIQYSKSAGGYVDLATGERVN